MFCYYFIYLFFWFEKKSITVLLLLLKKCQDTAPGHHGSNWHDNGKKKELLKSVARPVISTRLRDKFYCD